MLKYRSFRKRACTIQASSSTVKVVLQNKKKKKKLYSRFTLLCFSLVNHKWPFGLSCPRRWSEAVLPWRDTARKALWGDRNSPVPHCPPPSYKICFPRQSSLPPCCGKRGWTLARFKNRSGTTLGCWLAMLLNHPMVLCVLQMVHLIPKACLAMIWRGLGEEKLDYICWFCISPVVIIGFFFIS